MNKTININIGGYFFHIDENAYQKLKRYLEAVSKSLNNDPQGKDEIIDDIEARISELLSEKITDTRQVVNEQDINDIIKIMGEPEEYIENDQEGANSQSNGQREERKTKKLFRDFEGKFLGGVCAGMAYYLNLDVVWIRLAFIVTTIFSGIGLISYIILWVVTPGAKTTAEKLQMEGEKVTIDTIEKKIRKEFGSLKETLEDSAEKVKKKVVNGFQKSKKGTLFGFQDLVDIIGKALNIVFTVVAKCVGIVILFISTTVLIAIILGMFSLICFELLGYEKELMYLPYFIYDSMIPYWVLMTALFILISVPFLTLFILGLRIVSKNTRRFHKTASLCLLGIWIVALFTLLFTMIEKETINAYEGTQISISEQMFEPKETFSLKMTNGESLSFRELQTKSPQRKLVTTNKSKRVHSNTIKVSARKSDLLQPSVNTKKISRGRRV